MLLHVSYSNVILYRHIEKKIWRFKLSKYFITSYFHIHIIFIILNQFEKIRILISKKFLIM